MKHWSGRNCAHRTNNHSGNHHCPAFREMMKFKSFGSSHAFGRKLHHANHPPTLVSRMGRHHGPPSLRCVRKCDKPRSHCLGEYRACALKEVLMQIMRLTGQNGPSPSTGHHGNHCPQQQACCQKHHSGGCDGSPFDSGHHKQPEFQGRRHHGRAQHHHHGSRTIIGPHHHGKFHQHGRPHYHGDHDRPCCNERSQRSRSSSPVECHCQSEHCPCRLNSPSELEHQRVCLEGTEAHVSEPAASEPTVNNIGNPSPNEAPEQD